MEILEIHKSFVRDPQDEDSQNSDDHTPLPDKVVSKHVLDMKKISVPKLDLTKAFKIQEINAKKIGQPPEPVAQKPKDSSQEAYYRERLKRLETELSGMKKTLQHEMLFNKTLTDEMIGLQQLHDRLISANQALIKSNMKYSKKWRQINTALAFYKEFYSQYMDVVAQKRLSRNSLFENIGMHFSKLKQLKEDLAIEVDIDRIKPEIVLKQIKERDISRPESGIKHDYSEDTPFEQSVNEKPEEPATGDAAKHNIYEFSREECAQYLVGIWTELDKRMMHLGALGEHPESELPRPKNIFKLKRSISNPLDYVESKKTQIYDGGKRIPKEKKSKRKRKEKRRGSRQAEKPVSFGEGELVPTPDKRMNNYTGPLAEDPPRFMLESVSPAKLQQMMASRPGVNMPNESLMISFTLDAEELRKAKMLNEVSFISNNEEIF
eukprot:TRINITY_DN5127_c0_g1_i6.p1 TRINITY_DN5127_c0_g1~~TRINITY_DN5127_c0_g1_i6.p1  ORF type:complete len:436 (-),score=117.43 TRINITY_DN5127_c0_g1_i6:42-1349(-)